MKQKRREKIKSKKVVFRRAIAEGESLESQRQDADCQQDLRLFSESKQKQKMQKEMLESQSNNYVLDVKVDSLQN